LTHGEMSIDSFALGRAFRMRRAIAKNKSTIALCDLHQIWQPEGRMEVQAAIVRSKDACICCLSLL
jgi:hypothetical protein